MEQSALPSLGLHDIDANKPGGSIKIRVKTYVHSLKRQQERLEDLTQKKQELSRRLDHKRLELLRMKQAELSARQSRDAELEAQIKTLAEKVAAYQAPAQEPEPTTQPQQLIRLRKKNPAGEMVAL